MHIIKLIRWSSEEIKIFKELERWLTLHERANLIDDEVKAACRLARDPGSPVPEAKLLESIAAWEKIKAVMEQQSEDAAKIAPNLPEDVGGVGIISKPRMAYQLLEEVGLTCITDIERALHLARFGLGFLRGDLKAASLLDVRPEDGAYILQFENVDPEEL